MSPREAAKEAEARIQKALDEQTTKLDFSDLPLTTLPPALFECSHLTKLLCADEDGSTECQISEISDDIGMLSNLQSLDLANNPGLKIPESILSQGTKSILEYLRHRSGEEARQWRSKLVIVGQGGVGKTCLLDALNSREFNKESETTHGINIETVSLPHPSEEGIPMLLNAWDFGGQEIYHATHQFFLTDQSLFLFLWNARGDWEQGKPDYWLEMIQARAPEAPIILVATHTDERPADFPFKTYQERFPQIVGSIGFSNKERKNLDKLKSLIQTHAAELPLMGVRWPATWAKAYDTVCGHSAKHLTTEQYQTLLDQFDLNQRAKDTITTHLHNLGAILSYPDDPKLKHIVILNPEWVSTFISKILESENVEKNKGILSTREMETQWSELDHDLHEVFLELMEQYDLSYKIPDDSRNRSLVVEVLPQDRPSNYARVWEKPYAKQTNDKKLSMIYQLDSLQPGIPTWFIARSHRYTTGTHWRRGVILDDKKSQNDGRQHTALVEANPATSEINIAAQGRAPWQFFAVIREMFEDTLKRYPGLKTKRFIPCPGHDEKRCKYRFSYDNLLRRLDAGKTEAECQESFESFPITKLLFGISGPDGNREVIAASINWKKTTSPETNKATTNSRCCSSTITNANFKPSKGWRKLIARACLSCPPLAKERSSRTCWTCTSSANARMPCTSPAPTPPTPSNNPANGCKERHR